MELILTEIFTYIIGLSLIDKIALFIGLLLLFLTIIYISLEFGFVLFLCDVFQEFSHDFNSNAPYFDKKE